MYDEGMQQYKVWPSEGSHSDFAPRGEEQTALMNWVTDGLGYCEVEHVSPYLFAQKDILSLVVVPSDCSAVSISVVTSTKQHREPYEAVQIVC